MLPGALQLLPVAAAWNLNWLRHTNWGHADSRENKRPEQRVEPLAEVFGELNDVTRIGGPCDACKITLDVLKRSLVTDRSATGALFYGICSNRGPFLPMFERFCENSHLYNPNEDGGFSFLPDFVNALSELDPYGLDGEYLCHYMFSNACPRPETPEMDYSQFWPERAEPETTVQRSGETMRVLHLSDVHLSANYTEDAPANCLGAMCCESVSKQNPLDQVIPAPKYGHWRCDCPQALLDSSAQNSADHSGYAFALFTGDMVDHNPVFISQEETFKEEVRTMRSFKRYLGEIPVYPVLGNHDSYPYSQEPARDSEYANRTELNIRLMEDMWSAYGWIDDHAAEEFRLTHGGYAIEPVPGLKVVTLNSNYWYRWNFYNYIGMEDPDPSGMIKFLISELLDCEQRGIKAWVQAHVPPGGLSDEALPPAAALLAATLDRFSATVTGQFFGHTHLDEFSVLYANNATIRDENSAVGVAWIAPSITPYTDMNPAWRYYEVDTNTFEIMDAVTVFADIESGFGHSWSTAPDLEWEVLYSTREKYGRELAWPESEPLNGKFWHRAAKELLYNTDFARAFVKRSYRESSRAPDCSSYDCRAERYCYSTSMTPDQVVDCHEDHYAGPRGRGPATRFKYRHREYTENGGRMRGQHSYHGIPLFPMPRPLRYLSSLE